MKQIKSSLFSLYLFLISAKQPVKIIIFRRSHFVLGSIWKTPDKRDYNANGIDNSKIIKRFDLIFAILYLAFMIRLSVKRTKQKKFSLPKFLFLMMSVFWMNGDTIVYLILISWSVIA
ncbi:MAG: hypothetical protein ABIS01_03895, partial [Ferruginibacter sp.]